MSNSAKQETFIKKVIAWLEENGFTVTRSKSKHNKIEIYQDGNKVLTWGVSKSPRDRASAQRDALAELRGKLKLANVLPTGGLRSAGLLQFIAQTTDSEPEESMNPGALDILARQLSALPNLTDEDVNAVLRAVTALKSASPYGSTRQSADIQDHSEHDSVCILDPRGEEQAFCTSIVVVQAGEKKNFYYGYSLNAALKALATYYERCEPSVKLGVVVTNVWRPSEIRKHALRLTTSTNPSPRTVFVLESGGYLHPVNHPW